MQEPADLIAVPQGPGLNMRFAVGVQCAALWIIAEGHGTMLNDGLFASCASRIERRAVIDSEFAETSEGPWREIDWRELDIDIFLSLYLEETFTQRIDIHFRRH